MIACGSCGSFCFVQGFRGWVGERTNMPGLKLFPTHGLLSISFRAVTGFC